MTQGQPFDIPLFRELQKLLSAGGGPFNVELARQIGIAVATQGALEAQPTPGATRSYLDPLHEAEDLVLGYTRLPRVDPVQALVAGRAWWVRSTLEAWRWLFDAVAERLVAELGRLAGAPEGQQGAMSQVAPLLLGAQVGTLVGHLAGDVLGRYDLPIPRDDDGKLFFIEPNVDAVARDYSLAAQELHHWLALQSVARHVVIRAFPWVERYLRSLLGDLAESIEIDEGTLERLMTDMQTGSPEALQGFGAETLTVADGQAQRAIVERLHAFLATFEGYSTHAAAAVAPGFLGDAAKISETIARLRAAPSQGKAFLANLLGIAIDRSLESAGVTFCNAVVELKGIETLNHLWDAPDNLPTRDEITDPFAWMERLAAEE